MNRLDLNKQSLNLVYQNLSDEKLWLEIDSFLKESDLNKQSLNLVYQTFSDKKLMLKIDRFLKENDPKNNSSKVSDVVKRFLPGKR